MDMDPLEEEMLLKTLPDAFAYHEILVDDRDSPIDYIFLQVNPAFEAMTGLKSEDILGKRVREVLLGIEYSDFDWIGTYGEVALHGEVKRFEAYSQNLHRWYQVTAYSNKPGYFATLFRNITKEKEENSSLKKISIMAEQLLHAPLGQVDYHLLTEELRLLSNASYAALNLYDHMQKRSTTKAVAGISSGIQRAIKLLGYELEGKEWPIRGRMDDKGGSLLLYEDLYEAAAGTISKTLSSALSRLLSLGRVYVLEINYNEKTIGDIIFFMPKGEVLKNSHAVEILSRQLGLALTRAQAEKDLKASEQRFEGILGVLNDVVWSVSLPSYRPLYISPGCEELYGYTQEEFLEDPDLWYDAIYPDDRGLAESYHENLYEERFIEYEYRIKRPDGRLRWVRDKSWLILHDDGEPAYMYGIMSDITKAVEAKENLEELNSQLRERLRERTCLHEIISLSGEEDLTLETLLKEAVKILPTGFKEPEETCGRILYRGEEYITETFRVDRRCLESALRVKGDVVGNVQVYYIGEDESYHFYQQERELLEGIAERLSRIIERFLAEESLYKSREMLNQVLNSVPQSIFWKDRDLVYLGCNDVFAKDVGLHKREEIVGKTDFHLSWPVEEAMAYRAHDGEVIESREAIFHIIEPLQRADGTRLIIDTTKVPLIDSDGEVFGVLGVFEDITERKQMEDDLKRSNLELEQFAYAVSHDMRQPLRMITSYLQLLEGDLEGCLDEEADQYMHFVLDGAKRMDEMIVGLLDYSRVGRKHAPKQEIESRDALEEALSFLNPMIEEREAVISIKGEWPLVYASPDELTRLFQNLVGNAMKYSREGERPIIHLYVEMDEQDFIFATLDNGIGIPKGQAHRLFKVFSRLHPSSQYEGTGIGLALCRKIVEHHGGRIWVESEGEGEGSTFFFSLPSLRS